MKNKPDISGFGTPKDPSAFLEGGAADRAERPAPASSPVIPPPPPAIIAAKPEPTQQKIFRLRWDLANALKIHAAQQSAVTGKRVTETEIVEMLLRNYLNL